MGNNKVLVGMSEGVDSACAVYLLKKQGYEVIGMTLRLQDTPNQDYRINTARKIATIFSIPHYVKDVTDEFKAQVIDYFCKEYMLGRTPNPCIVCNEKIKFKYLLEVAHKTNCRFIATGHYVKVEYNDSLGVYLLRKGKDRQKEQSYFLYRLPQDVLKSVIFPLGNYTKQEVVTLIKSIRLPIDYYKSQDICFLKDKDYQTFLLERYKDKIKEGFIVNKEGKILGKHKGLPFYTIGQRKGLGLALGYPVYVISKDIEKNTLTIGKLQDCYKDLVKASECRFIKVPKLGTKLKAKVRYKAEDTEVELQRIDNGRVIVKFKDGVFAPCAGQSIVFYQQDRVIGGGIIDSSF
jgi:tRNA-specific 2-thiouridylase